MSLVMFRFECASGHSFEAPGEYGEYGELCMRSERDPTPALLQTLEDPVFDETARILATIHEFQGAKSWEKAALVQFVFGATCDAAPDGTRLAIGRLPSCPACGTRKMRSWEPAGRKYDGPVVPVSHVEWLAMADTLKQATIRAALLRGISEE